MLYNFESLKAYYFAKVCQGNYSVPAVIYIAEYEKLISKRIKTTGSTLVKIEEEIAWVIKPQDFYKYCEGYIKLTQEAFNKQYKLITPLNTHLRNASVMNTIKQIKAA